MPTYYLVLFPPEKKIMLTRSQYEHISLESTKTVTITGKGKYTLGVKFVFAIEQENICCIVATVVGFEIRGRDFLK